MFEKEAEEYQIRKHHQRLYGHKPVVMKELNTTFKDGAEFGYNKANEWHYMKDELPPENVSLDIITLDKNKKRRLWVGEYKGGNGQWWTGYFNHFIDVPYAWKEIVLPELKGEK